MSQELKILIYGYGNPGRQDDGLGIAFSERVERYVLDKGLQGFSFDSNYQLNIEDADAVAENDIVIFADASEEMVEDFCISLVEGSENASFTTHAASPGYVLHLSQQLFDREPLTYLVHIKGYEWEFSEGLSETATGNLQKALNFFFPLLEQKELISDPDSLIEKMCK